MGYAISIYRIKFGILEVRENEIALHKLSGGRTLQARAHLFSSLMALVIFRQAHNQLIFSAVA